MIKFFFSKLKVDVFNIEAVTLKQLQKIRIGHDGKNSGDGWFLKRVTVKQEGSSKYDQTFECNRWLAADEDDGQIVREFLVGGEQLLSTTSYHVRIKTGDKRNAGTDADVSLKIFGAKGDTGNQMLKKSNNVNKFESGKVDEFDFELDDIGKIEKIKIGHNGKGVGAGWFLDWIEIDVPAKGLRYKFSAHRWLAEDEGKLKELLTFLTILCYFYCILILTLTVFNHLLTTSVLLDAKNKGLIFLFAIIILSLCELSKSFISWLIFQATDFKINKTNMNFFVALAKLTFQCI